MKPLTFLAATAAVVLLGTIEVSAGTLNITSAPSFTPGGVFTANDIQAEVLHNPPGVMGDLVRLSGSVNE